MALDPTSAAALIREYARNAGDSTAYSSSQVTNAIAAIGHRFVRKTKCTRTKSALTLTSGSNALPALTALSGFRPEFLLRARLSGNDVSQPVEVIGYDDLLDRRDASDKSGAPEFMAFDTYTTGEVWGEPDFAYTLTLWWFEPWNTTTFNIPDAWLYEVLIYGATALMQHTETEHKYASESWKKYLEVEQSAMGMGNLGAKYYEATPDPDGAIAAAGDDTESPLRGVDQI